jgi:S1-C subfamily serine protease
MAGYHEDMRFLPLVALLISCGHGSANAPHQTLTIQQIVHSSVPAIVRIEAGEGKVGTGFIVAEGGLIATNLHVIEGEAKIRVKLYKDTTEYPVTMIAGVDRGHDLALIWIQPKKQLPVLHLGDSGRLSAGDRIYAIGNPLGVFDYSVTDGLISQVRELTPDLTILQISAAISPGSSGGPLFNQAGEVVGVTTAIITQGQAINLAVPANYLRPMIKQPATIQPDEFAKLTKDAEEAETPQHKDDDTDTTVPARQVPELPLATWDGCKNDDIQATVKEILEAIDIGAPAYNQMTAKGFEQCFRIYENTARKLEEKGACKGVRSTFGDGLLRADSLKSFKDKAWALRDTFDGLLNVAGKWCEQDAACRGGAKKHP